MSTPYRMDRPFFRTKVIGRHEYLIPTWRSSALLAPIVARDQVFGRFRRRRDGDEATPPSNARIAIAKLDHPGDIVQATALMRAIRDELPDSRICLIHGSWSRGIIDLLRPHGYFHEAIEYDSPLLARTTQERLRSVKGLLQARRLLIQALRRFAPTAFIDARATTPSSAWMASAVDCEAVIGFGLRGCDWRYSHRPRFETSSPLAENWLRLLSPLGVEPREYTGPSLTTFLRPKRDLAILHPGSAARHKEVADAAWIRIAAQELAHSTVVATGDKSDATRFITLRGQLRSIGVIDAMGSTTLADLVGLLAESRRVYSVESLTAHLAIGLGSETIVLTPPTRDPRVVLPRSNAVRVVAVD